MPAPVVGHREHVSSHRDREEEPRGPLVELVRLILVAAFAVSGWRFAEVSSEEETWLLFGIVMGSAVGYVVGGVLGRRTAKAVSAVERDFEKVPASQLLAGVIGLILGLVIAILLSFLLFRFPATVAAPTVAFAAVALSYAGYRLGRAKGDDFFALFGLRSRALGVRPGEVNVVDTSALIDGRILEVARAGFAGGTLLVLRGVLDELQRIADASDPARRARGQRGLRVLNELQRTSEVDVVLVEDELPGDVDAQLVRVARDRGGVVVTCDANLARVAAALDVPVRSMNELAAALRQPFLPGEEVTVLLSRQGREHGQGVGFLEDGTMVVVEDGSDLLGTEVRARVTNVLQTSSGRMVFARLSGAQ